MSEFGHKKIKNLQVLSFVTSPMRDRTSRGQNVDWTELRTNLAPFPRIRFVVPALAPLMSLELSHYHRPRTDKIISEGFKSRNQLAKCHPFSGHGNDKLLGCCVLFQGRDINQFEIKRKLRDLSRSRLLHNMSWLDQNANSGHLGCMKMGFTNKPHVVLKGSEMPRSSVAMCMLTNSTAIRNVWDRIDRQFDMLYKRRAFVHHFYEEGLEMDELLDARMNMATLEYDYRDIMVGQEDPQKLF